MNTRDPEELRMEAQDILEEQEKEMFDCYTCQGTGIGIYGESKCYRCKGKGYFLEERERDDEN